MFFENFVKYVTDRGGIIKPLLVDPSLTNGLGLMNPSVYNDNGRIIVNIRSVNYTLYNCDTPEYEHAWGPLVYIHPEDFLVLATENYISILDDNLDQVRTTKVDTSAFDTPPIWDFHGLEDARLVKWHDKFYMTGVRRDCNTIGCGRMELSEIEITDDYVKEISRTRVPTPGLPGDNPNYCEKNWMPILDQPYHYVKWGNPTEVVRYDMDTDLTHTVTTTGRDPSLVHDLRGGSQVIPYRDGYLGLHHITYLYKVPAGRRDGKYRHQFTYWDKNWNPIKRSSVFSFLTAKVEFTCGMCEYKDTYLITFGFMDNAAYILQIPKNVLHDFIFNIDSTDQ